MADPEKTEEGQAEGQGAESQTEGQETEGQAEGQVEGQAEGEAEGETKTVPYERLQEEANKVKNLEEQNLLLQRQIALSKANPPQAQAQAPQFDIYKEVGLEDEDDVPTVKQSKQIMGHYAKVFDSRLAELAFNQAHPDFAELVGTADEIAAGKYAEPLASAIKDNPALINMILTSANQKLAAYEIAKLQLKKTAKDTVKTDEAKNAIDEAVKNAARVKSASNVKGGGALSEEGRYESMPDKDFLELAAKHGAIV